MADIVLDNEAAPGSSPLSGSTVIYVDATSKKLSTKDDGGTVTAMPALATNALLLGSAAAAGAATTVARSNDTIAAFDATPPAAVGTVAVGVINFAARRDHVHNVSRGNALTTDTTINNTVTPTTGGVTVASLTLAANQQYRIRAWGNHVAVSSGTARNATVQPFWGATALQSIAVAVTASQALTSGWHCEFLLVGTSTTAIWTSGVLTSGVSIPAAYAVAGLNTRIVTVSGTTGSLTTTSTLDLRFFWSVSVATDQWVVKGVTMEQIA